MSYYQQLIERYYGKRPFFALNWLTELAHDWLSQVSSADNDINKLLQMKETQLQDTFLFMFSDHGHRFDPIRQTMIGRIEERMPFFSIHVPQKLLRQFPELSEVLEWNSNVGLLFF
jgi:membrane-anchored protein YejM (alkaline phosphatase superfamily)